MPTVEAHDVDTTSMGPSNAYELHTMTCLPFNRKHDLVSQTRQLARRKEFCKKDLDELILRCDASRGKE